MSFAPWAVAGASNDLSFEDVLEIDEATPNSQLEKTRDDPTNASFAHVKKEEQDKDDGVLTVKKLEECLWARMKMCVFSTQTRIIDDDGNVYRGRARLKATNEFTLPAGETMWVDSSWRIVAPEEGMDIGVFTVRPERKYFGIRIAQGLVDGM